MKGFILQKARELGIDVVGFTDNSPFYRERDVIWERKDRGCLSPFLKYDLDKNTNPLKVWDETKSIISVGVSYNNKLKVDLKNGDRGKFSKTSWGIDYHRVLMEKMNRLMDELQSISPGLSYRAFVDSAPLLDRAVAVRSGIGFYGKNGFVINPQYGSYLFLGHILVNEELGETPKIDSQCGSCDRCINACPTGALQGERKLDPNKCISYLSQKKGLLNRWERKALGISLYGCDLCQEVCPINKKAKKGLTEEFNPIESVVYPKLVDIVAMDNKKFKEVYRETSAGWRGKKILQRNGIIAAGNVLTRGNFLLLKDCLRDVRWDIRMYAMFSLLEYGRAGEDIVNENLKYEDEDFVDAFRQFK